MTHGPGRALLTCAPHAAAAPAQVQNMAYLEQAGGARLHLFGDGGVARCAHEAGCDLLGSVPIVLARPWAPPVCNSCVIWL